MTHDSVFAPHYAGSRALIIGINRYLVVSPLAYACNDADAVADHVIHKLAFPRSNVVLLKDEQATRQAITAAFMRFADESAADDRILVFFAGHGFTRTSRRGEVGYLVPYDGDPSDLSTLIRWDELTRNSDLLPAKHVLFIMDACYGGLALTRTLPPGGQRFLKDMLARYSRQVLTAGKADEVVADSGGPRVDHSIFTGHLLDALEGAARTSEGIVTANAVMAYVYDRVAKDQFSKQSPHYGFLDGDGDFVFEAPQLNELLADEQRDNDVLVEPIAAPRVLPGPGERHTFADEVKEYLAEGRYRIRLHDLLGTELRVFHDLVATANFPLQTATHTPEDVAERLRRYERAADRLACLLLLLARWGRAEHRPILSSMASRMVENNETAAGQVMWLGMRWHPADVMLCAAGIAALAGHSYENLAALMLAPATSSRSGGEVSTLLEATIDGVWEGMQVNAYKLLPGHERHFTPRSEYLFKVVQPLVEDLLYLGRGYEALFDRYEILAALTYADLRHQRKNDQVWGPPGRFAWKFARGGSNDPFRDLVAEAERLKERWPVLEAGFFGGSYERFFKVATAFGSFMGRLPFS